MHFPFGRLLSAAILTCLLALPSSAQQAIGARAWVDPVNGNDGTGALQLTPTPVPSAAFRTLNAAIGAASGFTAANPTLDAIVFALPGTYSPSTNGEPLPVTMRPGVHVMAAGGAKETVIQETIFDFSPPFSLFDPVGPFSGTRTQRTILVDFTLCPGRETILNAFTLRGADVQVYCETEGPFYTWRVSNCVFDMTNSQQIPGPVFGVEVVSIWDLAIQGYRQMTPKIFNCTMLQDTIVDGNALLTNVAIVNVNDPAALSPSPDPNQLLRQVMPISVQNTVVREFGVGRSSMLGVSQVDASVVIGFPGGSTNSFVPGSANSSNGVHFSVPTGAFPTPAVPIGVNLGLPDPAFLGDVGLVMGGGADTYDWRRLPATNEPLLDAGSIPVAGVFTSGSGITYLEPALGTPTPEDRVFHFQYDGEGFGNPRVASLQGQAQPLVDIGYDESDWMTAGLSWGRDTRSHNIGWSNGPANGTAQRFLFFPPVAPGVTVAEFDLYETVFFIPPATPIAWSARPGFGPAPFAVPPLTGLVWLWTTIPTFALIPITGSAPCTFTSLNNGVRLTRNPFTYPHLLTGIPYSCSFNVFGSLNCDTLLPNGADWCTQAVIIDDGVAIALSNLGHEVF